VRGTLKRASTRSISSLRRAMNESSRARSAPSSRRTPIAISKPIRGVPSPSPSAIGTTRRRAACLRASGQRRILRISRRTPDSRRRCAPDSTVDVRANARRSDWIVPTFCAHPQGDQTMNAIKLLKQQHREVAALFKQFEKARSAGPRQKAFDQIADKLAVHAAIEEKHFYPSVKRRATEEMLLEAVEEHLGVKRVIADMLDLDADDPTFEAKGRVLKDLVEHHVGEEEETLFPKIEKLLKGDELAAIGDEMEATMEELIEQGNPREAVPSETERAAPL
jgi:hemerythrin superfamily protein